MSTLNDISQAVDASGIVVELKKKTVDKLVIDVPKDIVKKTETEVNEMKGIIMVVTKNPKFQERLEAGVKTILKDGKLDQNDIPELVFIIMESYNTLSNVRLTSEQIPEFIMEVYKYIVKKLKIDPIGNTEVYEKLLVNSVKLVLLTPKLNLDKGCLCC